MVLNYNFLSLEPDHEKWQQNKFTDICLAMPDVVSVSCCILENLRLVMHFNFSSVLLFSAVMVGRKH